MKEQKIPEDISSFACFIFWNYLNANYVNNLNLPKFEREIKVEKYGKKAQLCRYRRA